LTSRRRKRNNNLYKLFLEPKIHLERIKKNKNTSKSTLRSVNEQNNFFVFLDGGGKGLFLEN